MRLNLKIQNAYDALFIKCLIGALTELNMSVRNRYKIARKYYKNSVILILIKKKLYIYKDNVLVDFKKINKLKELHLNYIILDNLNIIERKYKDNKYEEYYLKYSLNNILDNILKIEKRKIENE